MINIYFCDGKAEFSASILNDQYNDPSEMQKTQLYHQINYIKTILQ